MKDDIADIQTENRLDPRQRLMWNYYIDQTSETFSNAKRSAIKAGFSEYYSNSITNQAWYKDKKRRMHLLSKAEKVLNKILKMNTEDEKGKPKADVLRVQADMAKHVTKTLGKDEGYSEKTEVTGGSNIVFLPVELINKFNLAEKPKEDANTEDGGK